MTKFNYATKKSQLDEIISWFESEEIDFEEASIKYEEAIKIIDEIEQYLKDKSAQLKIEVK
ncbi:exodeoxyribonuclease VII small subunit [Candidatus Saccharibacteria bacterium]|nr:exodeoxyribonuclease VII small subunit [Candidatus Saccharibacteria bacterium]